MLDEQGDVGSPLLQRRDGDRHHLEPMVEITAEGARGNRILQVPVRGRENTDVDPCRRVGTDTGYFPGFQHPQELDLRRHRHVADLVEKQRASVGVFKLTDAVAGGVGERAPHMAEEFALQNVLAERGTVEGNEGLVLPRAVLMDGLGHEFFSGAGLTLNEHGRIGRGDSLEPFNQSEHLPTRSDDPLKPELLVETAVQLKVLPLEADTSGCLLDSGPQVGKVERFLQVGKSPLLHGGYRGRNGAMAGDDDHFGLVRCLLRPREDLQAADVVHHQVGDNDIERLLLDLPGPFRAAADHRHRIVEATQDLPHGAGMHDVVINHQHADEGLQP